MIYCPECGAKPTSWADMGHDCYYAVCECGSQLTVAYTDDGYSVTVADPEEDPAICGGRNDLHVCNNCGNYWEEEELRPIKDLEQRIEPGGTVPSGECPECGALCYPG